MGAPFFKSFFNCIISTVLHYGVSCFLRDATTPVRRRQEVVQIRRQKVAQTPFQGV